ncbi:hypothetical protein [Herbidospora cretacea]|uniref:hypothetical protein n=1 Tax=Herbidospora cretacea TaxID=28444 RepID=UPI0004C3F355|nr:hypothetical protein [Herbidospora cretacea]
MPTQSSAVIATHCGSSSRTPCQSTDASPTRITAGNPSDMAASNHPLRRSTAGLTPVLINVAPSAP